jgi:hypothetical protein
MHPVLRIWLFLASGWISWVLYRKRAPGILWVYFAFASYSAASFSPYQPDWWVHRWLWMEPIRMVLRSLVTIAVFYEIRRDRALIAKISALLALAITVTYRVTIGPPTSLSQFMTVRTYWLVFLWVFLAASVLCLWRVAERVPHRMAFWTGCLLCYSASSVIDWRITTKSGWEENTNASSLALVISILLWAAQEYLRHR